MLTFNQKLDNYAELIIRHGLNIQPGQLLNISIETIHKDFAILLTRKAYQAGAKYVNLQFSDPNIAKERLTHSKAEYLDYTGKDMAARYQETLETRGANLSIVGSEEPTIFEDADPEKFNVVRLARYKALKSFYEDGIGKSLVHWTVAAAATPKWGQQVFPDLDANSANTALWEQIFSICRVDQEAFLELWIQHNNTLQNRAKNLTDLQIERLHFTGPDTDLNVYLSPVSIWKGGSETGPNGVNFEPNLPTEECFTTPDCRKTNGQVRITRPVEVNGVIIKDLTLNFNSGKLINFTATSGSDTLQAYINSDPGASMLGEVALVGVDSPIYQSGLVFNEILFDENAACHIALGSAYKFCLRGGDKLSEHELSNLGCNNSSVHTDFMISSEQVSVEAIFKNGSKRTIIKDGHWCKT